MEEKVLSRMNNLQKVALYCRLSRDDGDISESSSIQNQKSFLKDYAEKHNWVVYDYYIDDGYTGTNFNRPGFMRMIQDIEDKKINIVITKDLSRLGRNYLDTGRYTEEYFPLHNVRYIAINDNFDSNNNDNEFAPFKNIINEWYAKDISKKVRSVFKNKLDNGILFRTSIPLYGYKYDINLKKRVIDEDTAPIIKYILEQYALGTPLKQIAHELTKRKILTPSAYYALKYNHNRAKYDDISEEELYHWKNKNISRLINNFEEYTGTYILKKSYNISFKLKKRFQTPREDLVIIKGACEAIISEELCERIRQLRRVRSSSNVPLQENIFKDLIYCGNCGNILRNKSYEQKDGRVIRYTCRNKDCKNKSVIRLDHMEKIVKSEIKDLVLNLLKKEEQFLNYVKEMINYKTEFKSSKYKEKLLDDKNQYTKRIAELERIIQELFESKLTSEIPENIYQKMMKKYREELLLIEDKLTEISKFLNDVPKKNNLEDKCKEFIKYLKSIDVNNITREDLLAIVKDIKISTVSRIEKKVIITYFYINDFLEDFFYETTNK